jgi:hypothetical protein
MKTMVGQLSTTKMFLKMKKSLQKNYKIQTTSNNINRKLHQSYGQMRSNTVMI